MSNAVLITLIIVTAITIFYIVGAVTETIQFKISHNRNKGRSSNSRTYDGTPITLEKRQKEEININPNGQTCWSCEYFNTDDSLEPCNNCKRTGGSEDNYKRREENI